MKTKNVSVIWISGETGSGKSTYAIQLARQMNKRYIVSSSSNDVMQDYTDEDVLILDDLRDNAFSFSDLLKLLDNHIISTVKSRYNNKMFLGDTIIVTSSVPIYKWYPNLREGEDIKQLYRRVNIYIETRLEGETRFAYAYAYDFKKYTCALNDNGRVQQDVTFPPIPIDVNMDDIMKASFDSFAKLGISKEDYEKAVVKPVIKGMVKQLDISDVSDMPF